MNTTGTRVASCYCQRTFISGRNGLRALLFFGRKIQTSRVGASLRGRGGAGVHLDSGGRELRADPLTRLRRPLRGLEPERRTVHAR